MEDDICTKLKIDKAEETWLRFEPTTLNCELSLHTDLKDKLDPRLAKLSTEILS
jgi:hypothetical protein